MTVSLNTDGELVIQDKHGNGYTKVYRTKDGLVFDTIGQGSSRVIAVIPSTMNPMLNLDLALGGPR